MKHSPTVKDPSTGNTLFEILTFLPVVGLALLIFAPLPAANGDETVLSAAEFSKIDSIRIEHLRLVGEVDSIELTEEEVLKEKLFKIFYTQYLHMELMLKVKFLHLDLVKMEWQN